MNSEPTESDLRPLRLVSGYNITADGRVFRAKDGKAVTAFTLHEARSHARHLGLEFDSHRLKLQPFGPVEPESLVYSVEEPQDGSTDIRSIQMVQCVIRPAERVQTDAISIDGAFSFWGGGPIPAVGNTSRHWYLLEHDNTKVLFHGPSQAAHERQR
jgi:hypothetical protein